MANDKTSPIKSGNFRELEPGFVYIVSPMGAVVDLSKASEPWIHFEHPWINYHPDRRYKMMQMTFRGDLTRQLAADLAKMDVKIKAGTIENKQWTISAPEERIEDVKKLLNSAKMSISLSKPGGI
jgi:hypothetical protein